MRQRGSEPVGEEEMRQRGMRKEVRRLSLAARNLGGIAGENNEATRDEAIRGERWSNKR